MERVTSRFGVPTESQPTTTQPLISRRAVIGGGLAGLGSLLLSPGQLLAAAPSSPFVILLKGRYGPVVRGPNLGLSSVNLNDGSYSTVPIYPVRGIPGNTNPNKAVGTFYVQFAGTLCAYHVPGGSIAMRFINQGDYTSTDDGASGHILEGTIDLTILEATGIYRPFVGGRNHMVDRLHILASGAVDEYCFCNVSRP